MHPERIRMSRGGERLEEVMGRGEDEELPEFDFGAFEIEVVDDDSDSDGLSGGGGDRKLVDSKFLNQYLQRGGISKHTMRSLVDSIRLVGAKDFQCSEVSLVFLSKLGVWNLYAQVATWRFRSGFVRSRFPNCVKW